MELEESMNQVGAQASVSSSVIFSVVGVEAFHYDRRRNVHHRNRRDDVSPTGVLGNDTIQDGNYRNLGDPSDPSCNGEYAVPSPKRREAAKDQMEVLHTDSTWSTRKTCTWGSGVQRYGGLSGSQTNTRRLG